MTAAAVASFTSAHRFSSSAIRLLGTGWMVNLLLFLVISGTITTTTTHWRVAAQECSSDGSTCDQHERCAVWREEGECLLNRSYMKLHCPVACRETWQQQQQDQAQRQQQKSRRTTNTKVVCEDRHERCHLWAQVGECQDNESVMKQYCAKACGFCGGSGGGPRKQAVIHAHDDDEDDDEDDDYMDSGDFDGEDFDDEDENYDEDQPACEDKDELCSFWAESGECEKNERYMSVNCAVSCDTCHQFRKMNSINSKYSLSEYETELLQQTEAFGVLQAAEGTQIKETIQRIQDSVNYMNDEKTQALPRSILDVCENRNKLCAFWAVLGECEKNQAYMTTNCAPSCRSCHMIDIKTRCPPLENAQPALNKGDLNKMFERILREAPGNRTLTENERRELLENNMTEYSVIVYSSPGEDASQGDVSIATDKSLPPWVITFENFLSDEECDELIQLGYKYGYKRSEDVGARKFDGTHDSVKSERRTSENAWCSDFHGCRGEDVPTKVHNRMSRVMGIPANNSEDLQMLRYEKGQFYRTHHDYIPHQRDRQCGPRILTFFLYLSDVEAGGGTNFPQLDLTVMPKKGRALLWPSVLNADPMQKDGRMMHQALDVEAGTKYAANGWIHMYDYVTPQTKGCN